MRRSLLISIFMTSILLAACGEEKREEQTPKILPVVLVRKIVFEETQLRQTYSATVMARIVSDQAFRISGKVVRRLVNIGDIVSIGTPLAEVDTSDLKLQLQQYSAEVTAAQKAFDQQITQTKRLEKLAKTGIASVATLDLQLVAKDEAQARLDRAQQALSLAQNTIEYAVLKADSDGVVTDTAVEAGQVIAVGQKAFSIADNRELEALVSIPESAVSGIAQSNASFSTWNDPERKYAVKLRELSPIADPATRTFAARFAIPLANQDLKLGMSGELNLKVASEPAAVVPMAAIHDQGQGPSVWIVDNASGKIELRPVKISKMGRSTATILEGVKAGEFVVALGAQKLDASLIVRPVETLQR